MKTILVFCIFISQIVFASTDTESAHGSAPESTHAAEETHAEAHTDEKAVDMNVIRQEEPGLDFKVPNIFWDKVPADSYTFSNVKVQLIEKNQGILKKSPTEIQFGRGGGTIDLGQVFTGKRGSFYLKFIYPEAEPRLFFISNGPQRKISENNTVSLQGSGCDKMMELTKFYKTVLSEEGLLLNTTDNRHLSVLAGHFIFSSVVGKQIRLAQVTFRSEKHKDYYCR